MIPLSVFQEMFEYNYWARDMQLDACSKLTNEQFSRPLGSSYASIRDTLAHLVGVEWIWLERWRGNSPTSREAAEFGPDKFPDVATVRKRWGTIERNLREYLLGLTEAGLLQTVSYLNLRGERWSYPLWRALWHLINHQSYHRGQVATLLRQLGIQPPQVDFLVAIDRQFMR
jgi:uncharacterized damage-inducible protein DinB